MQCSNFQFLITREIYQKETEPNDLDKQENRWQLKVNFGTFFHGIEFTVIFDNSKNEDILLHY